MHSPVTTSAAVPPLARLGQKGKPKTSFLRMPGTVLGWVQAGTQVALTAEPNVGWVWGSAAGYISYPLTLAGIQL